MNYIVRLARPADIEHLPAIERAAARLFPEEDLPARLGREATAVEEFREAQAAGRLWVAVTADGAPVGFAHLLSMEHHIHLEELDVHPDHGRRGLGRRLMEAVLDWATVEGYPAVTLTTFRHLPWNAPFYESLGFRRLHESELGEALRAELDWEAAQGLDRTKRVAMRRDIAGGAAGGSSSGRPNAPE